MNKSENKSGQPGFIYKQHPVQKLNNLEKFQELLCGMDFANSINCMYNNEINIFRTSNFLAMRYVRYDRFKVDCN